MSTRKVTGAEKKILSLAMSILGSRTSERKKRSSRLNAKRPRKKRAKLANGSKINKNKVVALANG